VVQTVTHVITTHAQKIGSPKVRLCLTILSYRYVDPSRTGPARHTMLQTHLLVRRYGRGLDIWTSNTLRCLDGMTTSIHIR